MRQKHRSPLTEQAAHKRQIPAMHPFHHLFPAMGRFPVPEQIRAAGGAAFGLALCGLVAALSPDGFGLPLVIIAPMGASAVLLFCAPNSPLAQPWSAILGNTSSALVALLVIALVPPPWTAAVAVGLAILVMMLLRALHPPGGAVALLSALDPEPVLNAGLWFIIGPVGVVTVALVLTATGYNRLTGRVYPFRQMEAPADRAGQRLGLTNEDLEALLARFNQSANMGAADLGRLLAAAEEVAVRQRFNGITCGDVMTRPLITTSPDASLADVAALFRDHPIKSVPVSGPGGRLLGLVLQADLLQPLIAVDEAGRGGQASELTAEDVMRPPTEIASHDQPIGSLLHRFARQGAEVVPVMQEGRLAGVLTRSDVLRLVLEVSREPSRA